MTFRKIIIFLYFVLNLASIQGLRFFRPRKKGKQCLIREGWNFHHVTCPSKYQKCCETGCCERTTSDLSLPYIRVFIVCALIVFIFMLVYIEMWCKKKCKFFKKGQHNSTFNTTNAEHSSGREMQILPVPNNDFVEQRPLTIQSDSDENTGASSAHSTPPPPYNSCNDTLILATPL